MVTVFLAEGFEEIEAVTPVDILRRGGVEVQTCSIGEDRKVVGAHGIPFTADITFSQLGEKEEVILLPGGMPGTLNLKQFAPLCQRILSHYKSGKMLAAICAAPTVFGALGLLADKEATCYPGMEDELSCASYSKENVVFSGGILTSRGPGTAAAFSLKLVEILRGKETAEALSGSMCFEGELI